MSSKIARTGKVKLSRWGLIDETNELLALYHSRNSAREFSKWGNRHGGFLKVVRLSGTVTYTLAK